MGGWGYFTSLFTPYDQQMFLIKTDSLGCDGTEFTCPMVSVPSIVRENKSNLVIYPNPAKESLTINAKHLKGDMHLQNIIIYDVYGRKVSRTFVFDNNKQESSSYTIDISTLQKGIYFIKIESITKKFIKL